MKRIAIAAILFASACTGTVYPYSSGPQYAQSSSTQQVTQSSDGSTTTTSSTETYQFVSNEAQPAAAPAPQAPPPPPVAEEPPPPPPSAPTVCDRADTPDMCEAWQVIVDVGDIIAAAKDESCKKAAASLNRYADQHAHEIDTLVNLDQKVGKHKLEKFQARHGQQAQSIMMAALDLDTRCNDTPKVDRALNRVGFRGLVGNRR